MAFVELRGVHGGYGGDDVLCDLRAEVARGELCALLGPNGAGKSTLLRILAGVVAPRAGTVHIDGRAIAALPADERARLVAVVPQHIEVALGFSVREVVAMGRAPHQGAFMRERRQDRDAVAAALAACELEAFAERPVASLSGGEQKRVHIARALAQETPVLLLDEAGAHLDVQHSERLYELVAREIEARGITCIAAMHDFNAALHHADVAVLLGGGRLVAAGPVAEVVCPEVLSPVFGVELERCEQPSGGAVLAIKRGSGSRPLARGDL